ncbi:MAG: hypothetical protein ACHQX1_02560 [Candidatus Micrarchaeales archaeon]
MDTGIDFRANLRPILARALNKNQTLILSEISRNKCLSISALLLQIETEHGISLSTLKLNARILRKLGLLSFGGSDTARLTLFGMQISRILTYDEKVKK